VKDTYAFEDGLFSDFTLDGDRAAGVKAEACAACRTYVKVFYEEARPDADPLADDAATIALDVMLADHGCARGTNLLVGA